MWRPAFAAYRWADLRHWRDAVTLSLPAMPTIRLIARWALLCWSSFWSPLPMAAGSAAPTAPAYLGALYAPRPGQPAASAEQLAAIGRAMFFDAGLSASGRVSCASCHDPRHAYGPADARPVQPGVVRGARAAGFRATPSLRYLQTLPAFSEHFFDNDGDDSIDAGPTGGHTWDGRVGSTHEQAGLPLLSAREMGNAGPAEVLARLKRSGYADQFRQAFGPQVFDDAPRAFASALLALEVFQQSPADFYPYSSRYDDVLRGRAALSEQESRGLVLFNDAAKGNCASCHLSEPTPDGAFPLFTDFGHIAIGVPRNTALPVNADSRFHDLGLCGPLRQDLGDRPEYCGRFRTPSLRNVALRQSFFHNGVIHSLAEAVRFYVQRDTDPARWYGRDAQGHARRFNDLPVYYHDNVNTDPPFGPQPGQRPLLNEAEIQDIVTFLQTLTDADLVPRAATVPAPTARGARDKLPAIPSAPSTTPQKSTPQR